MRFHTYLAIGLALFSTRLHGQAGGDPEVLIITNVDIVDTRQSLTNPDLTVIVRHGRIDSVAKHAMFTPSHKTQVVNGSGKYLIPGLWDMHAHSAGGPAAPWDSRIILPLYIANGVTGIRDMGGNLELLKQRKASIERGDLLGPHMFIAGPFLNGGKPYEYTLTTNTPDEARQAVDKLAREHVDFIKVLSDFSRAIYFAVADETKKQKLTFVGHVPDTVTAAEASDAGQRSIEHLSGLTLGCSREEAELRRRRTEAIQKGDNAAYHAASMRSLATYDPAKAQALFTEFKKNETWQVPTLSWWKMQSELGSASSSDPLLRYVPLSVRKSKEWDPQQIKRNTPAVLFDDLDKAMARYIDLTRGLHDRGVPVLTGTDSPDPFVFPGFSLHDELELLVQSGFTPGQALRAATHNPAEFLGKLSDYGMVEKGLVADLVLLDGNPLVDIRNTRKISAVIVGGKLFLRKDLDKMLEDVAIEAAKQ
jgi:imidazolonepropionase-like amidohydrolase